MNVVVLQGIDMVAQIDGDVSVCKLGRKMWTDADARAAELMLLCTRQKELHLCRRFVSLCRLLSLVSANH